MQMTELPCKSPVLIVDDDETFLNSLSAIIESWSYSVLSTTGGKEALKILGKKPVKAVLLDFQMPEMDGIECLRYIRRFYPQVHVVMITASSFDPKFFIDLGADAALRKPFNPDLLRELLDKLLCSHNASKAISGINTNPQETM